MNIVLIGYRCAGKSTVGKRLSDRTLMRFVDTDDLIEECHGVLIRDMVRSHGWDHFRKMERKIIKEISAQDNLIIALGGGAVLDPENIMILKKNGLIIWLKADREVLLKRMGEDPRTIFKRPTLTGKGVLEELEEVMAYRAPLYERAAEIELDTSVLDVEAAVEGVLSILQERIKRA
ncbi:MAG: shikimate kinase [Thermodesulfobacteriota bacterium]